MNTRRRRQAASPVAVGIVRCSTLKQDLSPSAQGAAIDAWAEREGVEVVAIYFDIGVSGTADIDERPGLAAALASLSDHGASILVAAKLDRLARDTYVSGAIDRIAAKAGARVVTTDGAADTALTRDIHRVLDAEEVRRIRARTKAALAVKAARNERVGGVPYGMRIGADGIHLEVNADEQRVIARAKELSDAGLTLRALTAQLNAEGFRNRSGKPFAFQSVYTFLRPLLDGKSSAAA